MVFNLQGKGEIRHDPGENENSDIHNRRGFVAGGEESASDSAEHLSGTRKL